MRTGQNGVIFRGYPFQAKVELVDINNVPVVSFSLNWRIALDPGSGPVITKISGAGIDPTFIPGEYLLTLTGAETALLTNPWYYHELKDDAVDDLFFTGKLSTTDTLEV
jgi:hypothetical protein